MDNETKALLLAFAALGGGIAIGWCLKMQVRRGAMRRNMSGSTGASTSTADDGSAPFMIPTGVSSTGCGCRSS